MDRTLHYTFFSEREDGEWEITKYSKDEEDEISVKEGLAQVIVDDYEFKNLSNYVLKSEYDGSQFSFAYNVNDSYEILELKGIVTFDVELEAADSNKIVYECDVDINDNELDENWSLAGSYIDDVEDNETTFGFRVAQDGDYAKLELYTKDYGEESCDVSINESSSMDNKGDFSCVLKYRGVKAEYSITFDKDGEISGLVEGRDGNQVQENMIAGEYTVEAPVSQQEVQLVDMTGDTITESVSVISYPSVDGEKIYVYSWNAELGQLIDTHFRTRYPELSDLVEYVNLNLTSNSDSYSDAINNAMNGNEVPSIVAYDIGVVDKFSTQGIFMPVSNVGITGGMYANAYDYTKQAATFNNELMALSWEVTPGCFTYDADIAASVLGASTPDEVNKLISNWDDFLAVAKKLKAEGYYIVPTVEDLQMGGGDAVPQYVIDEVIKNGYAGEGCQWDSEWVTYPENVFGYFGSTWFVQWVFGMFNSTAERNVAACEGPRTYYWSGTYIGVTESCTNPELAGLLLYTLCCDDEVMYDMYECDLVYPNNKKSVRDIYEDGKGTIDYMNNQNLIPLWDEMAKKINIAK